MFNHQNLLKMKKLKCARRQRYKAQKMLLASATPKGELKIADLLPEKLPDGSDSYSSYNSYSSYKSSDELEALLAERERTGYLKGRAEAVEACWVNPADPSPQSLEMLAQMGIGLDDSSTSPFAGRKSVWGPSN